MSSPSRRYLEQHEDDLLGDVTLEILDELGQARVPINAPHLRKGRSRHEPRDRRHCQLSEHGDPQHAGLLAPPRRPIEAPQYLHASLLFTDEAGAKLQALAEHNERLRPHLQMLRQARAVSVQLKPLTRIRPGRALGLWGAQRLVAWRIWLLACHPPCVSSG